MRYLFSILIALSVSLSCFGQINKRQEIFPIDFNGGVKNNTTLQYTIDRIKATDNATIVLTGGSWTITNNVTIPSYVNLKIEYGSSFAVDNPYTITMTDVKLEAGPYAIFTGAGAATGDADFVYRWPVWGDTTRFDIGDGAINESQIETWIENGDLTFVGGSTQRFDNAIITNLTFTTANGTTLTVDTANITTANITTGIVDNLTATNLTLGAGASNSVFNAVVSNANFDAQVQAVPGIAITQEGYIDEAYGFYTDSDTITVSNGSLVCNGSYFEFTNSVSLDVSGLTSNTIYYVCLDYDASTAPSTIVLSNATTVSFDSNKQGWYNGDDRCLWSYITMPASANIKPFKTLNDGGYRFGTNSVQLSDVRISLMTGSFNPNGNYQAPTIEASTYLPLNASHGWFYAHMSDSASSATIAIAPKDLAQEPSAGVRIGLRHSNNPDAYIHGYLELGQSRDVWVFGEDDDTNDQADLDILGWRINR